MTPIEIRPNKKTLIPMLALLLSMLIGISWYVLSSGKLSEGHTAIFFWTLSTSIAIFAIYKLAMKIKKNEPEIILSKQGIEINTKNGLTFFAWTQIAVWEIKNDDGTYYLSLETIEGRKKINVSWLEKTPAQIEALIYEYKGS